MTSDECEKRQSNTMESTIEYYCLSEGATDKLRLHVNHLKVLVIHYNIYEQGFFICGGPNVQIVAPSDIKPRSVPGISKHIVPKFH